jgi:predicted transcriptional regulator
MTAMRAIEVDEATAAALEQSAAEQGVSVAELLAEVAGLLSPSEEDVAELERRWAAVEAGEPTIPQSEVAAWLDTWGTPDYRPWRDR